jgi:hypothetical protein
MDTALHLAFNAQPIKKMKDYFNEALYRSLVGGFNLGSISAGPYFFLDHELRDPEIRRHCKIYKDKYFDYISKKEFNTLHEWAADSGGTLDNVLWGFRRPQERIVSYISLRQLLTQLKISFPTPAQAVGMEGLTAMANNIAIEDDVMVRFAQKLAFDKIELHDILIMDSRGKYRNGCDYMRS